MGEAEMTAFMSFEHYPLAPCEINWSDLYREPKLVEGILKTWRADGVPANVPLMKYGEQCFVGADGIRMQTYSQRCGWRTALGRF